MKQRIQKGVSAVAEVPTAEPLAASSPAPEDAALISGHGVADVGLDGAASGHCRSAISPYTAEGNEHMPKRTAQEYDDLIIEHDNAVAAQHITINSMVDLARRAKIAFEEAHKAWEAEHEPVSFAANLARELQIQREAKLAAIARGENVSASRNVRCGPSVLDYAAAGQRGGTVDAKGGDGFRRGSLNPVHRNAMIPKPKLPSQR